MTLGNVRLRFNRSLNKLREKSRPFVGHALGGYPEGTISYHAIPKFMIQTGDTPSEAKTFGVKKLRMSPEMIRVTTVRELCAWPTRARASGTQLFITMATPWRDKKHTIFGRGGWRIGRYPCDRDYEDECDNPFGDMYKYRQCLCQRFQQLINCTSIWYKFQGR